LDDDSNLEVCGGGLGVKADKFEGSCLLPDVTIVRKNSDKKKLSSHH
jgi:hypothetical protein